MARPKRFHLLSRPAPPALQVAPDPEDDPEPAQEQGPNSRALIEAFRPGIVEEIRRVMRIESDKALRASNKPEGIVGLVQAFYAKHGAHVSDRLTRATLPLVGVLRAAGHTPDLVSSIRATASTMVDASVADLSDPEGLAERVSLWEEMRPDLVADDLISSICASLKSTP